MAETRLQLLLQLRDEATRGLQTFSRRLDSITAGARRAGFALAGIGAALAGIGALSVREFAQVGDELQKLADATGFSTEALSELRFAAEQSGASLEAMEPAIRRMQRVIAQGDEASKQWRRSLDELGLSVDVLRRLSPEQQFLTIAEAISRIPDPATRTETAFNLFSESATKLMPLLRQGREGIEALGAEARELGIVFDRDAADAAAKMKDSMNELGKSVDGVKFALAQELVPILTDFADQAKDVIVAFRQWREENPELAGMLTKVGIALAGIGLVLGPLLIALPGLVMAIKGAVVVFGAVATAISTAVGMLGTLLVALGPVGAGIAALAAAWNKNLFGIRDVTRDVFTTVADFIVDRINDIIGFINGMIERINPILERLGRDSIDPIREISFEAGEAFDQATAAVEGFANSAVQRLRDLGQMGVDFLKGKFEGFISTLQLTEEQLARTMSTIAAEMGGGGPAGSIPAGPGGGGGTFGGGPGIPPQPPVPDRFRSQRPQRMFVNGELVTVLPDGTVVRESGIGGPGMGPSGVTSTAEGGGITVNVQLDGRTIATNMGDRAVEEEQVRSQ